MLALKRSETVVLTPKMAQEFANMPHSPGERPYDPKRTEWLKQRFYSGMFYAPTFATFTFRKERRKLRVNGQHTSTMLCQLTKDEFPKDKNVLMVEFEGDTEEDLIVAFQQFDQRESGRSTADTYWSHLAKHPDLLKDSSVIRDRVSKIVDGMAFAYSSVYGNQGVAGAHERAKLIHVHPEFVRDGCRVMTTKLLSSRPVVAAMLTTYTKNRKALEDFWVQVRDETHPDSTHPTRVLSRWLVEAKSNTSARKAEKLTPRGIYACCIHAWNAFRRGTSTALRYYKGSELPEPVA